MRRDQRPGWEDFSKNMYYKQTGSVVVTLPGIEKGAPASSGLMWLVGI